MAEPEERIAKSPLQRTLTVHIMGRWVKHEGALAHISLKRSVEMLELQCAQRFPARPADRNKFECLEGVKDDLNPSKKKSTKRSDRNLIASCVRPCGHRGVRR